MKNRVLMIAKANIMIIGALAAALLVFAACTSPADREGETGILSLGVGRAAGDLWNDMDVSTFKHTIWLYDTATATETRLASDVGIGMENYSITPGTYEVSVEAFDSDGELRAFGFSAPVKIQAGSNDPINISMRLPFDNLGFYVPVAASNPYGTDMSAAASKATADARVSPFAPVFKWYRDGGDDPVITGGVFEKPLPGSYTLTIAARGYITKELGPYVISLGAGVEGDPYIVYDEETLGKVGSDGYIADGDDTKGKWHLGAHYLQAADFTLPAAASGQSNWTAIYDADAGPVVRRRFTGVYDGGGFRIENLTIYSTGTTNADSYQGMFGGVGASGIVKNLALVNVNIRGDGSAGGVAGQNNGTIENCYVTGTVSGGTAGGVAGDNLGLVRNCYSTADVSGSQAVGGVAGSNGTIENCYSTGNVSSTYNWIGGVVGNSGASMDSVLTNSVALNRSVVTTDPMENYPDGILLGRVTGHPRGTVINSYARGDMTIKYGANVVKTPLDDANGMDGESITAAQWHSADWWLYTLDFSVDIWDLEDGKLPTLKGFSGPQNPEVK